MRRCLSIFSLLLLAATSRAQGPAFLFVQNGASSSVQQFTLGAGAQSASLIYRPGAPTNGTAMAFPANANGLAYDNNNQRLFLRDGASGSGNGNGNLFVWDQLTSTQRLVTAAPGVGALPGSSGNATLYNGFYWYVGLNSDSLVRVALDFSVPTAPTYSFTNFTDFDGTAANNFFAADIAISASGILLGGGSSVGSPGFRIDISGNTPNAATFVNMGATANNQLAYSQDSATLYGVAFATTTLNTIDTTTGGATAVGSVTLAPGTSGNITDMAGTGFPLSAPEPSSLMLFGPFLLPIALWLRRRS